VVVDREACLRLVTALAVEQRSEWLTGRRYSGCQRVLSSKSSACQEEQEQREVTLMELVARDLRLE